MTYMVELDEECRIQLPAVLRESLHLSPGSQLQVERDAGSDRLVLPPTSLEAEVHLEWQDGVPVLVGGSPVGAGQTRQARADYSAHVMGEPYTASDLLDPVDAD